MRQRKLIPDEHKQWLDAYLDRKGITTYPEMDNAEWRTLQGAYRQMVLKNKNATNALSDSALLMVNEKLVNERDKAMLDLRVANEAIRRNKDVIQELKYKIETLEGKLKAISVSNIKDPIKLADRMKDFASDGLALGNNNARSRLTKAGKESLGFHVRGTLSQNEQQQVYDWVARLTEQQRVEIVTNAKKDK